MTVSTVDPLLRAVEELLQNELAELRATNQKAAEIRKRIEDLRKLYPAASSNPEDGEVSGTFPKRMKPENLNLLRLIATKQEGFPISELQRLCAEQNLMDAQHLRFFIRNYRGKRYRLIDVLPSKNVILTEKGKAFLASKNMDQQIAESEMT